MQPVHSSLEALLTTPAFSQGIEEGTQAYQENIFPGDHTYNWSDENALITFVEREISSELHQQQRREATYHGETPTPYLETLGFLLGYLNEALTSYQVHISAQP